jgi:hypothetical protein
MQRDAEAVDLVWRGVYGRTSEAPILYWLTGADLDCKGPSGTPGFAVWGAGCVAGVAHYQSVVVAWWPGLALHDTALAHELLHAALLHDSDDDPTHRRPELWDKGGLLERANGALSAAGM